MIIWMYQSLIIFILFLFHDITAESVEGKINVSVFLGNVGANSAEIECWYNYSTQYVFRVDAVTIMAFNSSSKTFDSIVYIGLNKIASLTSNGQYLRGRVTLNNINNSSTKAVMIFNKLLCIDDTRYRCKVNYTLIEDYQGKDIFTNNIRLPVQVPPSKPDRICWKKVLVDSSTKTTVFDHSTFPTTDYHTTASINSDEELSTNIRYKTTPTFPSYDNDTTSSTDLDGDISTNIVYRTTTYSTQQTTTTQGIVEGYNITVVCAGPVGNPPVEHVFQRYLNGKIEPIRDSVNTTSIPNMPVNCSYYRTSNIEFKVTAADNNSVIRCVVNSSMADPDMYIETKPIEVYYNSTMQNRIEGTCPVTEKKSKGNLGLVVGIVGAVVAVIVVIIVIIACKRRKCKSPTFKNDSKSFDDSKPKPVTEPRTGDYDYIALEDDAPTKGYNNGFEFEDIIKHNEEYLKKQEEEEKKKNESNTPPQPAVYAQVNEATKLKNKPNTYSTENTDKKEGDPYAESQEDVYDKAGNSRHKENENVEHFDSLSSSKQNSNGDNKQSIQTSLVGSFTNQGFEKDDNRKVATVSPTVRSSTGSQNDEQTSSNRNSQSKKSYENNIGTDQTGISVEESSHRTAL